MEEITVQKNEDATKSNSRVQNHKNNYQRVHGINYAIPKCFKNICRSHDGSFTNSTSGILQGLHNKGNHIFPVHIIAKQLVRTD